MSKQTLINTQESHFCGRILEMEVEIDIEHSAPHQLAFSIVSPSGKEVTIPNIADPNKSTFKQRYTGNALKAFSGENTEGTWTLKVQNFGSMSQGHLKNWKLQFRYEQVDDLKRIQGIDTSIETILNKAGIHTYVSLAATSADRVREILETASATYSLSDTIIWKQKAALAALGRWEELLRK